MHSNLTKLTLGVFIACAMLFTTQRAEAQISSVTATSDTSNLYYKLSYSGTQTFFRLFFDTDRNASTGYASNGIGAEFLLENSNLYRYTGSGGAWGWTSVKVISQTKTTTTVNWTLAKTDLNSPSSLNYYANISSPAYTSAVSTQNLATVASSISLSVAGAPNLPYNGTSTLVTVAFAGATPTKVSLARDGLAAFATWPGGTFFTLSGDGKSISGNWCISASCWGNQSGAHTLSATATYADGSTKTSTVSLNAVTSTTTTTVPPATVTWTRCAQEGGTCSFTGTRQVRYGANGIYAYQTATGSIACSNANFGDPVYGVAKYCDYSSTVQSAPVTTTTLRPTTTTLAPPPTTLPPPPPTTTTVPVSSTGPTYYLSPNGNDANSGSASAPWRTIQKAANTVSAGATVILMNGSYEEPEIAFKRSGTASSPIVFKAQNKWQAIVSSISGCQPGISLYASHIHLKDLRFSVSSRNANCTIYTSANVHIRAWNSVNATPSNPTTGYVGFQASGLKIDGLNRSEGVKSNQDFTIFENSEVSHSIELFGSLNSIIRNNVVLDQGSSGPAIFAKGGVRNAQIYNNIVHMKRANQNAILIGGYSCDTCHFDTSTNIEAYNSVAYNNVVINESGGQISGLGFQGAKDSAFFNNVVINGALSMLLGGHNSGPQAPVSNPTFKNNIVVCSGAALTTGYFGWSYTGTLTADYNNFYNCSSSLTQSHPISGSPMFVNQVSDWRLQAGSPAINSGTAATMPAYGGGTIDISRDFNGVTRTTPWDLGIYNVAP